MTSLPIMEENPTCCLDIRENFLQAAFVGDFRATMGLLECPDSDIGVNKPDKKGRTSLYIASLMGHHKAVEVLLSNEKVLVNIGRQIDGGTAFSIASEKGNFEVMRTLIQNRKTDLVKGWCTDNWVHKQKPCRVDEHSPNETGPPKATIQIPGDLHFNSANYNISPPDRVSQTMVVNVCSKRSYCSKKKFYCSKTVKIRFTGKSNFIRHMPFYPYFGCSTILLHQ